MTTSNAKRVDRYIEDAPEFARPVLTKLRKVVHAGCPGVEETIKWGMPYFVYRGKILCGMAAFTKHVGFGFWQSKNMSDPLDLFSTGTGRKASMSNIRFHTLRDVPSQKALNAYVREARKLTDALLDS